MTAPYVHNDSTMTDPVIAHPWHGVSIGDRAPEIVNGYIEIVPTDTVKYEIDKASGLLRIDRPQRYSSFCPALYGFVPQTLCGDDVAAFCMEQTGRSGIEGDGDPVDLCVLTEHTVSHGGILLSARPIGGLRMIDAGQVDDKIIGVLEGDPAWGAWRDITECPAGILDRLRHYFLTYKDLPGSPGRRVEIAAVYGAAEALEILRRSTRDYERVFGPGRSG